MGHARTLAVGFGFALAACGGGGGGGGPVGTDPVLTSITLSAPNTTIGIAGRTQISAQTLDQNGASISGVTLSYQSSATNVATVDNAGQVTGVAVGQATITASGVRAGVTRTATIAITVSGTPPTAAVVLANSTSDIFAPAAVDVAVGGTVTWRFGAAEHNVIFASRAGVPADIPVTRNADVSRTFGTAGTFTYTCTLHANMNGSVNVR
jgi:plastocyanin